MPGGFLRAATVKRAVLPTKHVSKRAIVAVYFTYHLHVKQNSEERRYTRRHQSQILLLAGGTGPHQVLGYGKRWVRGIPAKVEASKK
jgi:hypothetical protein